MKFLVSFFLMALLGFAACLYLPWWAIAISCFAVAVFIRQRAGIALLTGFLSIFTLWAGLSFWISHKNGDILAHKMSAVLFKTDNPLLLVLVTGLIGGLVGGLSALTGSYLRARPLNK